MLPEDFDWQYYLDIHEDLRQAGFITENQANEHYLAFGKKENRAYKRIPLPEDFHWEGYVLLNPFVLMSDQYSYKKACKHYVTTGIPEKRIYKLTENSSDALTIEHPIYLFYHIWAVNDWEHIVSAQLEVLRSSGLWDHLTKVFINIAGSEDAKRKLEEQLPDPRVHIHKINNNFEFPTLELIRSISQSECFKGVYIHTKSVSKPTSHPDKWKVQFWRQLLDYQIIHHWRACYEKIRTHELVGTLFLHGRKETDDYWQNWSEVNDGELRYTDHFSGNYFWFDSAYFSRLAELTDKQKENRYNAEWYPFSGKPVFCHTFRDFTLWGKRLLEKIGMHDPPEWIRTDHADYSIIRNHYEQKVDVSVIISLYNYEEYIEKAVASVRQDDSQPLTELVIINDCSTDSSLSKVMPLLQSDLIITIIDKFHNTGLIDTRNIGILNSKGEYLFILDADNTIYPGCLHEHFQFLQHHPDHIACYATIECYDTHDQPVRNISNLPFDFERLKKGNYIDAMAMFNKEKLLDIGAYDPEMKSVGVGWEDFDLWLRIGNLDLKVGFIDKPLSRYLVKENSMLAETDSIQNKECLINYLNQKYGADIQ